MTAQEPAAVERPGMVVPRQGAGRDDDDRPLPDLPPLPADPRWRVEHLPFLSAVMVAALLCAAMVLPLGLATYVVKYTLLGVILAFSATSDWAGRRALGWGVVAGVLVWTVVQVWWVHGRHSRK
jgi:hypothetical protein